MVGILLTIKKPIKPRLNKFIYGFFKNIKSNSKNINIGNKVNPAAAGEGTPVKYIFVSISFGAKYISVVKRAKRKAEHTTKNKHKLQPKDFKSVSVHK